MQILYTQPQYKSSAHTGKNQNMLQQKCW